MRRFPDAPEHEEIDAQFAGDTAILTIDLKALTHNYRFLKEKSGKAECAAVVKANAYGLGIEPVVQTLLNEGCKTFFVANFNEARQLREISSEAAIFNMGGLFPDTSRYHTNFNVYPVLNTPDEINEWATHSKTQDRNQTGAAIQFNTGMNRLGLSIQALNSLIDNNTLESLDIRLLMSHLACADEPDHPLNRQQLERFQTIRKRMPDIPASLCNSAGIFLGPDYHFDLVRPGIALYGGRTQIAGSNPMRKVVRLDGRIAQIQDVPAGESVGYGAAQTLKRPSRIATISLGYADGFFRYLGSTDQTQKASIYISDHQVPVVGRISMDLITVDVTDIPQDLIQRGALVEIIGSHISVDDIADQAGTIGYEILTSLGPRYRRVYK